MFVLGITGGIGSGKTTVAAIVEAAGVPVIDADEISHQLTDKAGPTLDEIFAAFGDDLKNKEGTLDRDKLGYLVFQDKRALDELNSIIHKGIVAEIKRQLRQAEKNKLRVIALDVPLPVKDGFRDQCDQIWVVRCSKEKRLNRLIRRGLNRDEALQRMSVQMTDEEYEAIADYVIDNNGSLEELYETVRERLKYELEARGISLDTL